MRLMKERTINWHVALRKESVDRNRNHAAQLDPVRRSLSARRAWIEIGPLLCSICPTRVALRKESVDRNISREISLMRP